MIRDCQLVGTTVSEVGCTTAGETETCHCQGNYCNGATKTTSAATAATVSLVAAVAARCVL